MFSYLIEDESARFLIAARRQNVTAPLVGETTLLGQKVIDLAGSAADGVRGHVGLTADAPVESVRSFRQRFQQAFNYAPDHNCIKGYIAVYAIKAATERAGRFDREALAQTLHGLTVTPEQEPGILLATTWNDKGDIDRDSFLVEVNGASRAS